ncbi:hypothetical protein MUG94_07450 [Arthrobacter gengyunqii]|uniref:Uncharacterized protein n=1 Tax=Arthrobacter gengyunqii TaxID=2886940 RepID=A0A9X1M354_9MICC|nr:hypothetical protein [Arthrobacter gengyunqii]MCC3270366.1 hypothetical protein [Arthrobacter gengyunqii]UOY97560.1 hypothetical protein MUG94_07450 [Arthrobacter gengyunqii]
MGLFESLANECVPEELTVESISAYGDRILRQSAAENWDEEASKLSSAPLPELIALAEACVRNGKAESLPLVRLAMRELTETAWNLVFTDASDVFLNCPGILAAEGDRVLRKLLERFESLRNTGSGFQAYNYLETATRIALAGAARELRVVDVLLDLTTDDSPELLERVPRLLGIADEVWGQSRSRNVLLLLTDVEETRGAALFELGLAELRDSLSASNHVDVRTHLTAGRDNFLAAERVVESQDDASMYRRVLDAVLSFGSVDAVNRVNEAVDALSLVVDRRAALMTGLGVRDWLQSRGRAEVEWFSVARMLKECVQDLHRASWLQPAQAMERVLSAYRADRSITVLNSASGLRMVIQPVIHAAFIRREGLLAHLEDLASEPTTEETASAVLREFLTAVRNESPDEGGDCLGKALEIAPNLTMGLGVSSAPAIVHLVEQQPDLAAQLERDYAERRLASQLATDPLIDDLLASTRIALSDSPDFNGKTEIEFLGLAELIFQFMASRADIGRRTLGPRTEYLYPHPAGKTYTENYLQRDLGEFLQGTPLRPGVRFEESDVGSGRADLTVSTYLNRFSIEIKREIEDAGRESIRRKYSAQAAGYAVSSAGLGVLMVLDLTSHGNGVPSVRDSVWVEKVSIPSGADRFLLVGVVRGNRPTPSRLRVL